MKLMKTLTAGAAAIALTTAFAIVATPVLAQQTDGGIRGTVIDVNGAPIAGASITIVHSPSGTTGTATTSANGNFFEGGLRVGGPYTIEINAPGYEGRRVEGIFLQPGSAERIVIDLSGLGATDEIIVYGTRTQAIGLNNGAGSEYGRQDILNQPSVSRDVVDTLLRDPLVNSDGRRTGAISIGGVNPRLNALALDGVLQGDDFGLSRSIYATSRSPISLAAIESASVVASDYSVTASGFQGGLVNIVTKSGTNEFEGSGYWFRSGQNFVGEITNGELQPQSEFREREWGASLGGPIIKDRAFFFLSFEDFETSEPFNFAGNDAGNGILDGDQFFSLLNQRILDATGFDGQGRPVSGALPESSRRWLGKIDVNITDNHRLEASYQRTRETGISTSSTSFQSAFYNTPQDLDSYSGGIYSDWTNNFSTEFRVGFKDNERGQQCISGSETPALELEQLNFDDLDAELQGLVDPSLFTNVTIISGCDRFRHGNQFSDERLQIFAAGDYTWGDHVTKFGVEWESYDLSNLFASDISGVFRYDDLNQLATGDGVRVSIRSDVTGDPRANAAAEWGYSKFSAFLQNDWQVTSNFSVNGGIRYERFFQSDEPPLRDDFVAVYGRDNLDNLDGIDIIQPRVGFRYEPFDRTTLTGGFGIFSGGAPQVWVSNAFQPQIFEAEQTLNGVNFGEIPASITEEIQASDTLTPSFIDIIDPDFKIPSQWKASLKLDQSFDANFGFIDLGADYLFTLQYLFSDTRQDFTWRNIAQTDLDLGQGVAPDGRPIYANLQELGIPNAIELGNIEGGRSHVLTAALAKRYENGFNFDVSYAFQDVEVANSVTGSSRAVSLFRSLYTTDRNNPGVVTAPFETRHAFNLNFGYENTFFGNLMTRLDLFGTITSGQVAPLTFNTNNDNPLFGRTGNGESVRQNDLLYIPTFSGGASTDSAVVFASGFDLEGFANYIEAQGLEQGEVVDTGDVRGEWNQLWSFRFQQDLPTPNFNWKPLEGNQLKLVVDIFNVANLINDRWGTQSNGPRFGRVPAVTADLVSADDVEVNGIDGATALTGNDPATVCQSAGDCIYRYNTFTENPLNLADQQDSLYRIRVGIRYDF